MGCFVNWVSIAPYVSVGIGCFVRWVSDVLSMGWLCVDISEVLQGGGQRGRD